MEEVETFVLTWRCARCFLRSFIAAFFIVAIGATQHMDGLHDLRQPLSQSHIQGMVKSGQTSTALPNFLGSLQGNILRSHGREHAIHLFLCFQSGKQQEVKQWITSFAHELTSALDQLEKEERQRVFRSFFLSASGYKYFGLDFPKTYPLFDDVAFPWGMKRAQVRLNDLPMQEWEDGYQHDIHGMVLLAHNDCSAMQQADAELRRVIAPHTDICAVAQGRVIKNKQGQRVEPFGHVDNRSQRLFFQEDIDREEGGDGIDQWDPGAGPAAVLVPDPYGRTSRNNGFIQYLDSGSYLVFRKLEQNVRRFHLLKEKLADELELTGEKRAQVGAIAIGRFENGTPIVHAPAAGHPRIALNNFTYRDDPEGQKCPFHAHIRKMNPRQQEGPKPLIVRRGITYDERQPDSSGSQGDDEYPETGVGLLFMCYQKNIREYFEFLQREWANNPDLPRQGTGIDPIIGQPMTPEASRQQWPAQWDAPRQVHRSFAFHGVVTLKGGEYFFAPSLYFLKHL